MALDAGVTKWCASCDESFVTVRESCPECLCTLVDGAGGATECKSCGQAMHAAMEGCPACGVSVVDGPIDFATPVSGGLFLPRLASLEPFAQGAKCSLRTLSQSGQRAILGEGGFIEAHLEPIAKGLQCTDVTGEPLFQLVAYEAVGSSAFSAFDPAGNPLATFIRPSTLRHELQVRDGTSAPVGRLVEATGEWPYELRETGGEAFAQLRVSDQFLGEYMDDAWSMSPIPGTDSPLPLYGMVAAVVAAKLLIGGRLRRRPIEKEERETALLAALNNFPFD